MNVLSSTSYYTTDVKVTNKKNLIFFCLINSAFLYKENRNKTVAFNHPSIYLVHQLSVTVIGKTKKKSVAVNERRFIR